MRISTFYILALVLGLAIAAEKDLSGEESRDRRQNYNQYAAGLGRPQSTAGSPTSHIPGKILEANPFGVSPTPGGAGAQQHRFQTPQFLSQNGQGFRPQLNIPPGYGLGGPAYANIQVGAAGKEDREKEANALAGINGGVNYPFHIFGGIPQHQQFATPSAKPSPTPVLLVSTPRPALQSPSRGTQGIPSSRPTQAAPRVSQRPTASYRPSDSDGDFQYQPPGVLAVPQSRPQQSVRQQTRGPTRQQQRPQVYRPQSLREDPELESEEEEKEEEPDRLSTLLQSSKFDCIGRNSGYFADVGLSCEVFHYCQDNQKHSWICPNGFTFHQVHLICMPPGSDNICQKSQDYHFVNDFLYKPLNAEAVQRNPNTTLKYADRYFPETYGEYESQGSPNVVQRIQAQPQPQHQQQAARRPVARPQSQQPNFGAGSGSYRTPVNNQAFHSPEEVNIPLSQRRPQTARPTFQQYSAAPGGTEDYDYDESPYRGKK